MGISNNVGCVDCGAVMMGRYCADCGARTPTRPITIGSLVHDLVHGMLHADKGVVYTFRQLLRHPGATPHRHIEGRTTRLTMPFHYLILCCAFAAAVAWGASRMWSAAPAAAVSHTHDAATTYGHWIGHYGIQFSRWTWLVLLGVSAGVSRFFFRRSRLSYAEHLAFAAYTFGQMIVLAALAIGAATGLRRVGVALPVDGLDAGLLAALTWYLVAAIAFHRGSMIDRATRSVATAVISIALFLTASAAAVAAALAAGLIG